MKIKKTSNWEISKSNKHFMKSDYINAYPSHVQDEVHVGRLVLISLPRLYCLPSKWHLVRSSALKSGHSYLIEYQKRKILFHFWLKFRPLAKEKNTSNSLFTAMGIYRLVYLWLVYISSPHNACGPGMLGMHLILGFERKWLKEKKIVFCRNFSFIFKNYFFFVHFFGYWKTWELLEELNSSWKIQRCEKNAAKKKFTWKRIYQKALPLHK